MLTGRIDGYEGIEKNAPEDMQVNIERTIDEGIAILQEFTKTQEKQKGQRKKKDEKRLLTASGNVRYNSGVFTNRGRSLENTTLS